MSTSDDLRVTGRTTYRVKELFLTLQGEGMNVGRPAVFCRFSGCNLWTGHESTRSTAICQFCDTDFVGTDGPGGGAFHGAAELADAVLACWRDGTGTDPTNAPGYGPSGKRANRPLIVCTGGEPLLQLDEPAVDAFRERGFEVAIETNGTLPLLDGIDWVCVSPKVGSDLVVHDGEELKLVFPQDGGDPAQYEHLAFDHFLLSPMDGPDRVANTELAINYCLTHPRWRLSVQTHKYLGIP